MMLTSAIDKFVALWKGFMDCAPWVADQVYFAVPAEDVILVASCSRVLPSCNVHVLNRKG